MIVVSFSAFWKFLWLGNSLRCGLLQYANYLQILLAQSIFFSDREQNVSSWNLFCLVRHVPLVKVSVHRLARPVSRVELLLTLLQLIGRP